MPDVIALENISDAITLEIVKKIIELPTGKKKALLELLSDLPDELNSENAEEFRRKAEIAEWKKEQSQNHFKRIPGLQLIDLSKYKL